MERRRTGKSFKAKIAGIRHAPPLSPENAAGRNDGPTDIFESPSGSKKCRATTHRPTDVYTVTRQFNPESVFFLLLIIQFNPYFAEVASITLIFCAYSCAVHLRETLYVKRFFFPASLIIR